VAEQGGAIGDVEIPSAPHAGKQARHESGPDLGGEILSLLSGNRSDPDVDLVLVRVSDGADIRPGDAGAIQG
jgi:hypothetical protein